MASSELALPLLASFQHPLLARHDEAVNRGLFFVGALHQGSRQLFFLSFSRNGIRRLVEANDHLR